MSVSWDWPALYNAWAIEEIMRHTFGFRLDLGKKIMIAAAAIVASAPLMQGQAQPRTFDVASVKLAADQTVFSTRPQRSPGRFAWKTQFIYLLEYAFDAQYDRISETPGHTPGWGMIYEVVATTGPQTTDDEIRLMVRSLLEDRFKMAWHYETKQADGWALTVAKKGPKIHEYKDGDPIPPMPDSEKGMDRAAGEGLIWDHLPKPNVVALTGRKVSLAQLCGNLERSLRLPVWDETGLKGKYYIALRYATKDAPIDVDAPPLSNALQEQLGLKLEKRKGPVQLVVIERNQTVPTEN